jgi:nucleoside-diphosphate-sugar epimerase
MRILISGATGVIGWRVIPLLLSAGYSVTALARDAASSEKLERAGASSATGDLFDLASLKKAASGHDAIINLATHMPSAVWKMLFRPAWRLNDRIRTEGVANIVEAALACGVGRLIQESFAPTYPDRGDSWIDEHTMIEPAAYNRTVADAEASTARFTAAGGTGVVLRFGAFYGPDAMQVKSYVDALRMGWAALPGSPDAFISSISHDDAATAVVAALNTPAGAYNVVDDAPLSHRDYFGSLAENLGLKPPRFLPAWATPLLGTAGPTMARSLRISNRKLTAEAGWAPELPSVREGWPVMLKQMKEAGLPPVLRDDASVP